MRTTYFLGASTYAQPNHTEVAYLRYHDASKKLLKFLGDGRAQLMSLKILNLLVYWLHHAHPTHSCCD
jgi:hypothetical protein